MSYPQPKNSRPTNPILNDRLVALANRPSAYLQDRLLPVLFDATNVPEGQESNWSGTIQRVNEGAMFGDPGVTTLVARKQTIPTYEGAGYDPMTFESDKYAIIIDIAKEDKHIVQSGSTPNTDVQLAGAVEAMKLDREKVLAALFMTTGNWRNSTTLGAAAKWDVQATSDPNEDLSDAVYAVSGFGEKANVCILGRKAADVLRKNSAFLEFDDVNKDRTILNDERLKAVISSRYGIKHVFIGEAVTKTAGDSQADNLVPVNVWDDDVWVGYLPMDDAGVPSKGITVGQVAKSGDLIPMQRMAAAVVKTEDWSIEADDSAGFEEHTVKHKVVYMEVVIPVQPPLGYVIASVAS